MRVLGQAGVEDLASDDVRVRSKAAYVARGEFTRCGLLAPGCRIAFVIARAARCPDPFRRKPERGAELHGGENLIDGEQETSLRLKVCSKSPLCSNQHFYKPLSDVLSRGEG